jgi:hypothetical protein
MFEHYFLFTRESGSEVMTHKSIPPADMQGAKRQAGLEKPGRGLKMKATCEIFFRF